MITAEYIGSGVTLSDIVKYVRSAVESKDTSQSGSANSCHLSDAFSFKESKGVRITSASVSLPSSCSLPQFWDRLVAEEAFYRFYDLSSVEESDCLIDSEVCALQPHIERAFLKLNGHLTMPFGFLDKELKDASKSSLALMCIASIEDVRIFFLSFEFQMK